ncbi:MAG: hypothetical protein ABW139_12085 [Candidatus Thiodiazotropha sp. DIVDIV]
MKKEILDEVIACLSEERTLFHYFKGQYAFFLLFCATKEQCSVNAIKQSQFQHLLNQPDIKSLLSHHGHGKLIPELFEHTWKETSQPFVLTVDRWGNSNRWDYQTTRKGCNLVLQLNFSEKHNRAYHRLVKPDDDYIFNYNGHPVMDRNKRTLYRDTLAWARIDFDLDSNEALIEEIQSDWVRSVLHCLKGIKIGSTPWHLEWCNCKQEAFITYAEKVLAPFYNIWSEAMLTAAIRFIYTELGIRKIYYHTHETGQRIKRVFGGSPPRSIYSDLPRKFCFQITNEDPEFIKTDRDFKRKKRNLKQVEWYKLAL